MELGILAAIAGIVGVISGILASWASFAKNVRKDNNKEGERMGALQSDIGYIKKGVDNIERKQDIMEERHYELAERVKGVEGKMEHTQKRLDRLESRDVCSRD
jgi:chromosome segregation ATPase